ncbi:hypothetical protein D3C84_678470 [compost metagenome]
MFVERAVQRQRIDLREQFIQGQTVFTRRAPGQLPEQHAHAEGFGQACHGPAQFTVTEHAEGLALQLDDREVQQAELLGPCPLSLGHGVLIVRQARSQRQQQGQGVLGDRRCAVALAVADHDALGLCGLQVDIVGTGGGHQDQLQVGAGSQGAGVDHHFVADRHGCAEQAIHHLIGGGGRVQLQLVEATAQTIQAEVAQVQGMMVEEYGAAQGGHGSSSERRSGSGRIGKLSSFAA